MVVVQPSAAISTSAASGMAIVTTTLTVTSGPAAPQTATVRAGAAPSTAPMIAASEMRDISNGSYLQATGITPALKEHSIS